MHTGRVWYVACTNSFSQLIQCAPSILHKIAFRMSILKMRELRGAGVVVVRHISGDSNPADIFTKELSRQPIERHRKTVLNLPGGSSLEAARMAAAGRSLSLRDGTGAP